MKYFSGQWPTENNAPITLAEQLVKTRFVFWNPKNGSNCYSLSRDFLWNIKCVTIFKYIYFFIMENLYYKESLPLLAVSSVYVGHVRTIQFVGSWTSFLHSLHFSCQVFGRMESINMAGVLLQEAGDADSKVCTRSQV